MKGARIKGMPSDFLGFLVAPAFLCFILIRAWIVFKSPRRLPLPPGPRSYPLIGHLFSIPTCQQETVFYEMGKKYGDVIYLRSLGKSFIILNSAAAASDLLDKRSHNYSGRPSFPLFELMGWNSSLTLLPCGKQLHLHRRMMQQHLNRDQCAKYQCFQTQQAHLLVKNILSRPERRNEFVERYGAAIGIWIAYGHEIISDDDWHFQTARNASKALFSSGPPGGTPVDLFPFLRYLPSWFPGTRCATFAINNRSAVRIAHEAPIRKIQAQMIDGNAKPSFAASQLEGIEREGAHSRVTIDDVEGVAAMMHIAGTDTISVTLSTFILAMVLHPEVQARGSEEIDALIGPERLPEFRDRQALPFVECIFQETIRWHQAAPLGLPHYCSEDDEYNGMFIPKGSIVLANMRAMTLDSNIYKDPSTFNPCRYLPKPAGNGEPYPSVVFGWGRRICPGRHLASGNVWIAIASILATTTVSKAILDDGQEITPEIRFTSGLVNQLSPYRCNFQIRNNTSLSLLEEPTSS